MSIFEKPVSAISAGDLQELLTERAVENVRLEFKSEIPDKDETLKKLSSFANTFGGYLVVGAKASSKDGRIEDLRGVQPRPNYKQTITQWCFEGANPPLTAELSDAVEISDGKVAHVIHVPESDVAPHFLNGRKGVWVRTDEFSSNFQPRLATENELRGLLNRREAIERRRAQLLHRAGERFVRHAANMLAEPQLSLGVVPRFPSRPLCAAENLTDMVVQSETYWRSERFPASIRSGGLITQHESVIVLNPARRKPSMFEANVWGLLFYGTPIEAKHGDGSVGIHVGEFAGTVLAILRHAAILMKAFGYLGALAFEANLRSVRGAKWLRPSIGGLEPRDGSVLDDSIHFSVEATADALMLDPDEIAASILRVAFFSMGWPQAVSSPANIQDVLAAGYLYNGWSISEKPVIR
jgi:Putative DNA-binding domain